MSISQVQHRVSIFSLVSQSSSHYLSHETALEQFLLLIFEYTNSPAGISHFGEHIGFEHCNNRNRLRLCMCTIHGRGVQQIGLGGDLMTAWLGGYADSFWRLHHGGIRNRHLRHRLATLSFSTEPTRPKSVIWTLGARLLSLGCLKMTRVYKATLYERTTLNEIHIRNPLFI